MLRIRKILYPTDFSEASREALSHALFLAEQHEAELHLLHAIVLHADDPHSASHHFPAGSEIFRKLYDIAGSALAALSAAHSDRAVRLKEVQRRGFNAADVILEYAAEEEIDLVVMGTHGRRGPRRLLLGSVTEEVVRRAPCAVLTLRDQPGEREIEAFERLLVPLDFSDQSETLVRTARHLAATYGAAIDLLHVIQEHAYPYFYGPIPSPAGGDRLGELQERTGAAMEDLWERIDAPEVEWAKHVISGQPASEIAHFADERGSDLLVIATHGLTGLERILVGSTAEQVVRMARCPVFTVKSFGRSILG